MRMLRSAYVYRIMPDSGGRTPSSPFCCGAGSRYSSSGILVDVIRRDQFCGGP